MYLYLDTLYLHTDTIDLNTDTIGFYLNFEKWFDFIRYDRHSAKNPLNGMNILLCTFNTEELFQLNKKK